MQFTFPAIGIIHSCFKEKFGIPRQPGLVPLARAQLELLSPYDDPTAFDGLSGCSHIWVQFVFHANQREEWKPKVKPPRLGGNRSLGVFATRSPTRPSPIGLSVVKLEAIQHQQDKLWLELSGVDFLDGTPVLDIKPYVPYVDCIGDAVNEFAPAAPVLLPVSFNAQTEQFSADYGSRHALDLRTLIVQILQQDPRPQYQTPQPGRVYGMKLLDLDVRWQYAATDQSYTIRVTDIAINN